jgi:hypothetical protein
MNIILLLLCSPEITSGGALAEDFVLPPGVLASISLPPSLFGGINGDVDSVGIFFALYSDATLFPIRDMVSPISTNSTLRPVVASPVIAATVGPGFNFSNLATPVEINLRLNVTSFEVMRSHITYTSLNSGRSKPGLF